MYYIDKFNSKEHVYPVYGRQFAAYRWYKPLITGMVFAIVYLLVAIVFYLGVGLVGVAAGNMSWSDAFSSVVTSYDDMDLADPVQSAITLGGNAIMIPCLALAALIVRDRPMSSYSSARGGWSGKVFCICFVAAFLCKSIPIMVDEIITNHTLGDFQVRFTILSFLIVTILGPLQCIGEEYIFRGLLLQTFGSWCRIPVIAIILQAALFAAVHPYNMVGKCAILVSGLTYGVAAWLARGLEASSALHVANNMTIFYMQGLNLTQIGSEISVHSLIFDIVTDVVYIIILFYLSLKTKSFNKVTKDDAAKANAKYAEKKARKAAKKAQKANKKAAGLAGEAGKAAVNTVSGAAGAADESVSAEEDGSSVDVSEYTGGKHFKH